MNKDVHSHKRDKSGKDGRCRVYFTYHNTQGGFVAKHLRGRPGEIKAMGKKYYLLYESPGQTCEVEADNYDELLKGVPVHIAKLLTFNRDFEGLSIDEATQKALKIYTDYKIRCSRGSVSSIVKAEIEADVVKCYLQNMTYAEIVEWLKVNNNVNVSMSAIGRFCKTLIDLRIAPLGSVLAMQYQAEDALNNEL